MPYVKLAIGAATNPLAPGPLYVAGTELKLIVKVREFTHPPCAGGGVVVNVVCGNGIFNTGINVELTPLGVLPLTGSPVPLNSVSEFCGHN
jgi:hypothetical protein